MPQDGSPTPVVSVVRRRSKRGLDRHFWFVIVLAAAVLIPRAWWISRQHSEYIDDAIHILYGLRYWEGNPGSFMQHFNDPPLGEGLIVLPLWLAGVSQSGPIDLTLWPRGFLSEAQHAGTDARRIAMLRQASARNILYGQPISPPAILTIVNVWKAILWVPAFGLIFQWARMLYGLRAGWLTAVAILFEPNFAAFVGTAALDGLVVEAILLSCFLWWRYFQQPTRSRLVFAGISVAVALLIKHNACVVPVIVFGYAILHWVVQAIRDGETWQRWRTFLRARLHVMAAAVLIVLASMWVLLLFDVSVPRDVSGVPINSRNTLVNRFIDPLLYTRLPGGSYIGSLIGGWSHNQRGHQAYLFGRTRTSGWWYYFPVVAAYKIPIGMFGLFAMGFVSLWWRRPDWAEWSLAVPLILCAGLLLMTDVNIGFRHALPAYALAIMLACRCLDFSSSRDRQPPRRWATIAAVVAVGAAGLHGASFGPDYLCYINYPRDRHYLDISDSNVDWGQSIRQVGRWLDAHPPGDRPVYLGTMMSAGAYAADYYLGDRVRQISFLINDRPGSGGPPRPTSGLLIVSPTWPLGFWDVMDRYGALRRHEPVATIGHCMLVYDLDKMGGGKPFQWPPIPASEPADPNRDIRD